MTRWKVVRGTLALAAPLLALAPSLAGCGLHHAPAVGAGFAAKVTCSLAHNSGQNPQWVIDEYVVHEAKPLGPLLDWSVDPRGAHAQVLGVVDASAVLRPGLGCTLLPGDSAAAQLVLPEGLPDLPRKQLDPATPWPYGAADPPPAPVAIEAALDRAFAEPDPTRERVRNTTAIVIAHDGRLVAERYAKAYSKTTPMLSWSMAKSVTAALVGIEVGDGRLALRERAPVPEWSDASDPRHAITLDHLLRMSSGLDFDETYGATNDVSRMLFQHPDVGAFAARSPLAAPPDTVWSYSSGTSNIVARILRDLHGKDLAAQVRFARERLFDAADMTSAFFEPDVTGTFIGSSFAFMTARDWARFGELHRNDGVWNGRRILPEGWVRYVSTPTPKAPNGEYGAHWWLNHGAPGDPAQRMWPRIPADAFAATGHSGQFVLVIPSARLVVVRLGLSLPDGDDVGLEDLVEDVLRALGIASEARTANAP
ncbi:MAG: serine hydrolase [Proteobacteria bacterium]|nr:MAG: serine hydrolase [Pseudomonadota bacterium]